MGFALRDGAGELNELAAATAQWEWIRETRQFASTGPRILISCWIRTLSRQFGLSQLSEQGVGAHREPSGSFLNW